VAMPTRRDPAAINPDAAILRTKPAASFVGLGPTSFWKLRKTDPDFPPAIPLGGGRAIGFRRTDLLAWLDAQASKGAQS